MGHRVVVGVVVGAVESVLEPHRVHVHGRVRRRTHVHVVVRLRVVAVGLRALVLEAGPLVRHVFVGLGGGFGFVSSVDVL